MAQRWLVLALTVAMALAACSGGLVATPTPPAGATATPAVSAPPTTPPTPSPTAPASPTVPPATATPLPEPSAAEVAAWAADICAINATFLADNQQITTDIPEPADRTLDALKQVNAERQPRVEQAYGDAVDALGALTPYPGGEAFRLALVDEFQSALGAMPSFFQAIADATSVEEIDAQYANRGAVNSAGLLGSARAVTEMDVAFSDAVAAVTTGCRFFEYDARARVHGIEVPAFSEVAFEDSFDDDSNFGGDSSGGSTTEISAGSIVVSFDQASWLLLPAPHQYHDARIETRVRLDGSLLAGVVCRGDGPRSYEVVINELGLILIYQMPDNQLLGRRAAPEGFDASAGMDLAVECFAGNSDPFSLVVYVDDELVAEVQQEHAFASEGRAGLYAQAFAPGATATFDEFRVLVPTD